MVIIYGLNPSTEDVYSLYTTILYIDFIKGSEPITFSNHANCNDLFDSLLPKTEVYLLRLCMQAVSCKRNYETFKSLFTWLEKAMAISADCLFVCWHGQSWPLWSCSHFDPHCSTQMAFHPACGGDWITNKTTNRRLHNRVNSFLWCSHRKYTVLPQSLKKSVF